MTRLEDPDLLAGRSRFVADIDVPGCLYAHFVRATDAHGIIAGIDVQDALASPGVVAVHTADSMGLDRYVHMATLPETMARFPLAKDRVRHVGEALAVVVADTPEHAEDAAELVFADIEPIAAIVDPVAALDAPPIYPEAGTNLVLELERESFGGPVFDEPAFDEPTDTTSAATTGAATTSAATTTVEVHVANQRLASAPIETDGIIAIPDGDGLDVWCTSQGVHAFRTELSAVLGIPESKLRVRSPAVGGAFGGRVSPPVEFAVVAKVALELGVPVRWHQSRFENLTGMPQGRDIHSDLRMSFDDDGRIVELDVDVLADVGATAHAGAALLVSVRRQAGGLYRVPKMRWRGRGVLTNTPPVGAYRGAGQPEANHARERVLDVAARRLGIDPVDLRLRNLHAAADFPLTASGGVTYDSADPVATLERAVALIDMDGWRVEQARRRASGDEREIGIGVSCYAQTSGRGNPTDSAVIRVGPDGRVEVACGTPSHGQGHRTTWANLISRKLGVAPSDVDVVDNDTAAIDRGLTTGGSRASQVLATALVNACDVLVDDAKTLAARELEASEHDIVVVAATADQAAGLAVQGVPSRRVTWASLAGASDAGCLEAIRDDAAFGEAHPYGSHATVVEVDVATGHVRLLDHVAVDDCGVVLEPEIVAGQQHGGSVAGIAQALWEFMSFDSEGEPQTALFTNYGIPSAVEVCNIRGHTAVAEGIAASTDRNVLGSRGIGENGCNGATAAAHNAVMDALAERGVEHVDLPLTPERVWRAIHDSGG